MAWTLVGLLLVAAVLGVATWPRGGGVPAPPPDPAGLAEAAAVRTLRARLRAPESASIQAVRVYRPGAAADEHAVCGRILAPELPGGAADFVARVILRGTARPGMQAMVVLEEGPGLARGTAEAQRRYCRDAPPPGAPPPDAPMPPSAQATPDDGAGAGAGLPPALAAGGGGPALAGKVVVRAPVNLRAGPGGGAAVLSTLPRGQVVAVFERAPGGWLRVGDAAPWGWIHASLVAELPP